MDETKPRRGWREMLQCFPSGIGVTLTGGVDLCRPAARDDVAICRGDARWPCGLHSVSAGRAAVLRGSPRDATSKLVEHPLSADRLSVELRSRARDRLCDRLSFPLRPTALFYRAGRLLHGAVHRLVPWAMATASGPKPRSATTPCAHSPAWQRGSNKTASGKPWEVHLRYAPLVE